MLVVGLWAGDLCALEGEVLVDVGKVGFEDFCGGVFGDEIGGAAVDALFEVFFGYYPASLNLLLKQCPGHS